MPPRLPAVSARACPHRAPSSLCTFQATRANSTSQKDEEKERGPRLSKQRREMFAWLTSFEQSTGKGSGSYLGPYPDQPFPLNPHFRSQAVLDEELRELIWKRITQDGESMKVVSASLGVDIRRIAAVIRMKEIEKRWVKEGKPLARPYAKAIMSMLPQTSHTDARGIHEPITDVNVHSLTMQQIFLPTSESRHFTRADAAKAFHKDMLPPEKRLPHKELIQREKDRLAGVPSHQAEAKFVEAANAAEAQQAKAVSAKRQKAESQLTRVETDRFEFRFQNFDAEVVGRNGRSPKAVGWRYGVPLSDRKRGEVKIPTQVP